LANSFWELWIHAALNRKAARVANARRDFIPFWIVRKGDESDNLARVIGDRGCLMRVLAGQAGSMRIRMFAVPL
jgi:hypothetical protein